MRKLLLIPVWLLLMGAGVSAPGSTPDIDARYQAVRARYASLRASPVQRANRENWDRIITELTTLIGDESAKRPRLDARMRYTLGMVYFGLYGQFRQTNDLQKAHDTLNELVLKYPANPLADDALFFRGEILHKLGDDRASVRVLRSVLVNYPDGNRVADAQRLLNVVSRQMKDRTEPVAAHETGDGRHAPGATTRPGEKPANGTGQGTDKPSSEPVAGGNANIGEDTSIANEGNATVADTSEAPSPSPVVTLSGVKIWTNPDYTRIVLEVSDRVSYDHKLQMNGPNGHPVIRVTLTGAVLDEAFAESLIPGEDGLLVPVSGGLLRTLSLEYAGETTLELTLDVGPLRTYRVTPFQSPSRILIDLFGKVQAPEEHDDLGDLVMNLDAQQTGADRGDDTPFVVVLDAGHGGKDTGAIGPGGTREKDVVLAIAKRARDKLEAVPGVTVVMVRDRDVFVPLPERTAVANRHGADLFVSIHANALSNPNASGVETYYLDTASDQGAARLAAKENATLKDHSVLDMIVQDLVISGNVRYSKRLAQSVQQALVTAFRQHYPPRTVRDLGVKSALFYVLFGAQMPSILVEVSFVSNPVEEIRLASERYQEIAAEAIRDGVLHYRRETATLSRAEGM